MTTEELEEFRYRIEDLLDFPKALRSSDLETMVVLLDELIKHRKLLAFLEGFEDKVLRLTSGYLSDRVLEKLDVPFAALAKSISDIKGENPPPPTQHILWGDRIICDNRRWKMWSRVENQTCRAINTIVLDGASVSEEAINEYQKSDPCQGCLQRLPTIVTEVRELMGLFADGWSAAALGREREPKENKENKET